MLNERNFPFISIRRYVLFKGIIYAVDPDEMRGASARQVEILRMWVTRYKKSKTVDQSLLESSQPTKIKLKRPSSFMT